MPQDLDELIRRRERSFDDATAPAPMYTEDAILLDPNDPAWIRGRLAVADYASRTFGSRYRLTPAAYSRSGSTANIAGYLTRGDGDAAAHFAHVLLSLARGDDGAWRIAAESLTFTGPSVLRTIDAADLVAALDAAGIRRALVLSVAYLHGDPRRRADDEYAKVMAENDWTSRQVAQFPDRLRGFCSFSPIRSYALQELERCRKDTVLSGIKLHLGNSGVDLFNPEHVKQLREVFRAANARRWPIVVHLRTRKRTYGPDEDRAYGRKDAEIFLSQVLPAAPDIPVQIAHLAGAGPGYDTRVDFALAVFAQAVSAGDKRVANLYVDVTTNVTVKTSAETAQLIAKRLRQLGLRRILYGTDLSTGAADGNPPPRQAWATFRTMLPLTDDEFRVIAGNVAPYMRER